MVLWTLALILLFLYIVLDVNYFVRISLTYVIAKYFRKKISVLDPSVIYGIVLPNDADFLLTHMNNSRCMREYDFARIDLGVRMGLISEVLKRGGSFVIGAATIRYRLPIKMFSLYKIISRIVYWDSKFLYADQRIVTLHDGIVRSVGYIKIACLNFDAIDVYKKLFPDLECPEMPDDFKKCNEAYEISREMMKKQ